MSLAGTLAPSLPDLPPPTFCLRVRRTLGNHSLVTPPLCFTSTSHLGLRDDETVNPCRVLSTGLWGHQCHYGLCLEHSISGLTFKVLSAASHWGQDLNFPCAFSWISCYSCKVGLLVLVLCMGCVCSERLRQLAQGHTAVNYRFSSQDLSAPKLLLFLPPRLRE